jgi:hypothetical protein
MSFPPELVQAGRAMLEDLARKKAEPITYSEFAKPLGLAAISAGGLLKQIEETMEERGVLLSALVVSKRYRLPSAPFFDLAKRLKRMKADELPQEFRRDERTRVYNAYA